VKVESE